ncbi:MAG: tetratricopeptide repeat protein [Rhodospirillales bacterium]|nr:tetratricopeptide repeat protein [Alphaproteobacteria bacterium]MCB9976649.1 tetratricopeptide repeat protein [Rhodospirillales bacterium]
MKELRFCRSLLRFPFFALLGLGVGVLCVSFSSAYAQGVSVVVDDGEAAPPESGLNSADAGAEDESAVISGPSAVHSGADTEADPEAFFDAEQLVPQGEMSKQGPKRVNPVLQPASKLITVRKNAGPDSTTAQLVSAERAMSLGLYDSALDMFDGLYAKNKRDPRVLMGRAVALQNLGRFEDAMRTYEELSDLDPGNVDVKVNMLGLLASKFPAIAMRRLMDLYEQNPNSVGVIAQLAVTEANLGDFESAIKHLGIAASIEPENAGHIYNMAVIADRMGQTSQAITYYEQALEVDSIYGSGRSIPRDAVYERLANIR